MGQLKLMRPPSKWCKFRTVIGGFVCEKCGMVSETGGHRICGPAGMAIEPPARIQRTIVETSPRSSGILIEADLPCPHRSGPPELLTCKPCQTGGITPLLFVCAGGHELCTLQPIHKPSPTGERYHACSTCEERNKGDSDTR